MVVHICDITPAGVDGHGRHARGGVPLGRWADSGMTAVVWREPRADDPVAEVLDASCPLDFDQWELCRTEYGAFLVRFTQVIEGQRRVWESWRREDDEAPMRDLFERVMAGQCR